jgi:hypothetical protein
VLDVPADPRWLSHGASLRLTAPLGHLPLAVELDTAVGSRPTVGPADYRITVYDVPIGLALVARLQRGRWLLSAGPRVSLHLLGAAATATDGRSGDSLQVSAGLGTVAQARVALADWVAAALTITAEALVPERRFTVDGMAGASPGPFAFSTSLGLVFRLF